jgi:hypothetical protein
MTKEYSNMESVKELKKLILSQLVENGQDVEEAKAEITKKYDVMAEGNPIFKSNKQIAYNIIAREYNVQVKSTLATSGKKAFPLKIGEIQESEKANFDISGYLTRDLRTFRTSKDSDMMYVNIADDTGSISFGVFEKELPLFFGTDEEPSGLGIGSYITVHNLHWADKSKYSPNFGKYSSYSQEEEASFGFKDIVVDPISAMVESTSGKDNWYTIKGIVTYIPEENKKMVYHGMCGHWFSGKDDNDIGELEMCAKCNKPMEVWKNLVVDGAQFADAKGVTTIAVSPFAELQDMNAMEEYLLTGPFKQDVFNVNKATPISKKN